VAGLAEHEIESLQVALGTFLEPLLIRDEDVGARVPKPHRDHELDEEIDVIGRPPADDAPQGPSGALGDRRRLEAMRVDLPSAGLEHRPHQADVPRQAEPDVVADDVQAPVWHFVAPERSSTDSE
jgi:hypothetical protein